MTQDKEFLGTEPVGRLLWKLAVPTVIAQLVNMLYNIVDRIYIGHIPGDGSLALTGVGVCLPIIMIISAFSAFVSSGGAPRASIAMGRGDYDQAQRILGGCFTLQVGISLVLTAVLLIWNRPLLLAFGASGNTIGYAVQYMQIYALGTLFVELTLGLNAFITAQGFAQVGMKTVLIGAVCNILLDPLFIFALDMGVRGAALATVLSQAVSCVWVVTFLRGKQTLLRLEKASLPIRPRLILPCVALGAAVQAGRLGGEALTGAGEDLLLMDVTPLTLSIETLGGVATHLIERNATIPTRFSKVFTTAAPFQSTVEIKVLQGEREFAKDNKLLGTFTLRGIKRAWAGVPKIEVTFDLDANGIVKVSARDMDTGKEQGITITGSSNLSEDEIQKAMRNAAAFAGQDQERKAALEAFNAAEAALYRVNTALGSKAGKALDRDTRSKIKDAVRALEKELRHKKADKLTTADVQSLNAAREALSAIATPLVTQWESEKG